MHDPTKDDIHEFERNGYWISPKLIDDDRIHRLREAIERIFSGDFDGHGSLFDGDLTLPDDPIALRRVINSWWVNDEIQRMVLDPGIGRMAGMFMGVRSVRLWGDQAIIKPGSRSHGGTKAGNVGWHQDAAYWHINSERENMVTVWIALQDTDLPNGGMRTLAGSHRWGLIDRSDGFYDADLDRQREDFEQRIGGEWIDEPCVLKAGQASFHHSLCFHGSEANRTLEPRLSIVGHYMPDGAKFIASGRYQAFLPLLGPGPQPGQPFTDPVFPRVVPELESNPGRNQ